MGASQYTTIQDYIAYWQTLAKGPVARAGFETGVIQSLQGGQLTSAQLAESLRLDPWKVELLCAALCETGLLERYEDDYALSPVARLLPNAVPPVLNWKRSSFESDPSADSMALPPVETLSTKQWIDSGAALDVAEALDIGKSRRALRILEVGSGNAIFSATCAHRDPDCQVTLIDSATSLELARQTVDGVGIAGQFEFQEGDYRAPKIDSAFDLILVVGLAHRFTIEGCQTWMRHLITGLKTGGELAIIDYFHGQSKGATQMALLEFELTMNGEIRRLHRPPELRTWLMESGLSNVQFAFLPSPPHTWGLLLAQR